ncbi:MAG: hypothetical protein R3F13_20245 [Prosthecobacter sp.]
MTRILINEAVEKGVAERLSVFVPKERVEEEPDYENLAAMGEQTTFPIGLRL